MSSIGRTEAVHLLGNIQLDGLRFCFTHARQFTHLHDPYTQDLLIGVLALHGGEGVREPRASELGDQSRLTKALASSQGQHVVKFTSGAEDTCHGSHKGFSCNRSGIGVVLGSQVVNQ